MYIFLSKCTYLYSLTFSTTTIISSLLCQKGKRYVPWLEITERHFYAFRKWTPLSFQMASDSGWWVGSSCRKFGSGGLPILPVGRSCQKNEIRIIITQHFPENLYIFPELDFTKLSTYFTLKFGDPPNSSLTPGWKWNKEMESFFMFCPCVSKKEDKKESLTSGIFCVMFCPGWKTKTKTNKKCFTCGMNCVMFCPGVSAATRRRYCLSCNEAKHFNQFIWGRSKNWN